jgi:hypothetical protein
MLAARVSKLIALRKAERADRKVALVMFNFPPNAGRVGTAAHLSVFESVFNTLKSLKAEGYSVDVPASIDEFRREAQIAYRHLDRRAQKTLPLIPGAGIPIEITHLMRAALDSEAPGRAVDFDWADLSNPNLVFEIDRLQRRILLNTRIQQKGGSSIEQTTVLLKVCLYYLLEEAIEQQRESVAMKAHLDLLNNVLGKAMGL